MNQLRAKILERLYKYDSIRTLKDRLRPLKHFLLGKSGIYHVVDSIKSARNTNPVRIVFDCGSADGDTTLTVLRHFPEAIVYCFEPHDMARQRFLKRTARWENRVVLFDHGLYSENREILLRVYSYRDASSILPLPNYMRIEGKSEVAEEKITVRRLDDCLRELAVARIDLMKIDVEGVEKEVLEGAVGALSCTDNIFIEISPLRKGIHSRDYIDVFDLLHKVGFTLMGQYDGGDYWFSKDLHVLKQYLDATESPV